MTDELPTTIKECEELIDFIRSEQNEIADQLRSARDRRDLGKNIDEDWYARACGAIRHRQKDIRTLAAHRDSLMREQGYFTAQEMRAAAALKRAEAKAIRAAAGASRKTAKDMRREAHAEHLRKAAEREAIRAERAAQHNLNVATKVEREAEIARIRAASNNKAMDALCAWLKHEHPNVWDDAIHILKEARK